MSQTVPDIFIKNNQNGKYDAFIEQWVNDKNRNMTDDELKAYVDTVCFDGFHPNDVSSSFGNSDFRKTSKKINDKICSKGSKVKLWGELPNRSDRVMVYVEGVSTIEEARAYVLGLAPELEPVLLVFLTDTK